MSSNIQVAALSDVGCVRTNNEDNFGYDPVADLYVVCDGMGGMAAGEVASAIACSTVITTFASQPVETPIEVRLALAIRAANDAVVHSGQLAEHKGMGTTLVCAAFTGSKLLIGNVGDSRCYLFQNGACMQVTLDHSYVNELVRAGTIKIEDIPNLDLDQFASVITRAIGAAREVEPDFFFIDLHPGDAVLLASDGLTRYVEGNSIAELVDPSNLQGSCQDLINKAKAAGGADNITCILLRYDAPATIQPKAHVETPLNIQAQAPTEAQPEIPLEVSAEAVAETAMETPAEAQAEEPTAELDAPAEAPVDAPAVVDAAAPSETETEAATEAGIDEPADAKNGVSFDALLDAASEPKAEEPTAELDAPVEAAADAPAVVEADAPVETEAKAATDTETDLPAETSADAPTEITIEAATDTETDPPTETRTDAPAETPSAISFEALLEEASKVQSDSSSGDPLEALFEAEPEAKPTTSEVPPLPVPHEQQV